MRVSAGVLLCVLLRPTRQEDWEEPGSRLIGGRVLDERHSNCSWTKERYEVLLRRRSSTAVARDRARFWKGVDPRDVSVRFVNAGQGTSATHWIKSVAHAATVPTIHWQETRHLPNATAGAQFAKALVAAFEPFRSCLMGAKKIAEHTTTAAETYCDARRALAALRPALRDVLTRSGAVVVVDTPYPYLVAEIVAARPDVVLLHTLRDPDVWADKRAHEHTQVPLCAEEKNATTALPSSFELADCVAASRNASDVRDLFEQAGHARRTGLPQLAAKYAAQRDYVQSLVPPTQYVELCAWDSDIDAQASALTAAFRRAVVGSSSRKQ